MNNRLFLNAIDLIAIFVLFIASSSALILQITHHELPCALCVMQRMGLYAMAFGLILNITKERTLHNYLLVILAALINSFIAMLQVLLHIVPGTGSFGDAFLGLHLYTWTYVLCIGYILYATIAGLVIEDNKSVRGKIQISTISKVVIGLLVFTLLLNIISAFMECGPYLCPSDPQSYWLIDLFNKVM